MIKNNYQLIFSSIAQDDVNNILNNKSAAKKIYKKLLTAYKNILIFPYGNPIINNYKFKHDYRELTIKRYSYSIIYYIYDENKIIISRILHSKRSVEKSLIEI